MLKYCIKFCLGIRKSCNLKKKVWEALGSTYANRKLEKKNLYSIVIYFFVFQNCQALTSLDLESVVQFSSVAQLCPTLCDSMNRSTPGLPVHHQLQKFTQTHVHWVGDAIQPSHPLSSPSPPTFNLSQHQGLFKWVSSSHQVAKILELQLQHQSESVAD